MMFDLIYVLFTDYYKKEYILYCFDFSPIAKTVNIVAWCKFDVFLFVLW